MVVTWVVTRSSFMSGSQVLVFTAHYSLCQWGESDLPACGPTSQLLRPSWPAVQSLPPGLSTNQGLGGDNVVRMWVQLKRCLW